MSRTIILIPTTTGVGLTSVTLGLVHALEQKGTKVGFLKPIAQPITGEDTLDRSTSIIKATRTTEVGEPFMLSEAETLIGQNQTDVLLEKIVERHQALSKNNEVIVVEGLIPTRKNAYANSVNYEVAQALDAEIVLVAAPGSDKPAQLKERVEAALNFYIDQDWLDMVFEDLDEERKGEAIKAFRERMKSFFCSSTQFNAYSRH